MFGSCVFLLTSNAVCGEWHHVAPLARSQAEYPNPSGAYESEPVGKLEPHVGHRLDAVEVTNP